MNFETKLRNFGLSEKEAKVYIALLELGESPASDIAAKSGVKRATTYVVLDSLAEKGLVSTFKQDSTTHYIANSPDTLERLIQTKKEELRDKEKSLNAILPDLKSLHNKEESKPVIRFFEGKEGLAQSAKEFYSGFKEGDESVKMLYSRDKVLENTTDELRNKFREKRLNQDVKSEVIYNYIDNEIDDPTGERIKVDHEKFPISIDFEIYGDKIFITTLQDKLSAILIKNNNIAESLKTLFRLAQIGARAEQEKDDEDS